MKMQMRINMKTNENEHEIKDENENKDENTKNKKLDQIFASIIFVFVHQKEFLKFEIDNSLIYKIEKIFGPLY